MAKDKLGLFMWEEYSEEEKKKFVEMEIWKDEVFNRWCADMEAEEMKKLSKLSKSSKRKGRMQQSDIDGDGDGYIE